MKQNRGLRKISDKEISFGIISESRDEIFGFATLWLVLFHSTDLRFSNNQSLGILGTILDSIKNTGNVGVDIFLFLSGIGLYFSYKKTESIKNFYYRRSIRILPTVLICTTIWFGLSNIEGVWNYLSHVFLLGLYIDGDRYFWYFSLLILLYFLYPVLEKSFVKLNYSNISLIIFSFCWFAITKIIQMTDYYAVIEIALNRVPSFVLGCWLGERVYRKTNIPMPITFFSVAIVLPLFKLYEMGFSSEIHRYIGILLAIDLVLILSLINNKIKIRNIKRFLKWIGSYSMEIYLIYSGLGLMCKDVFVVKSRMNLTYYIPVFILTIILSIILKIVSDAFVQNLIEKK